MPKKAKERHPGRAAFYADENIDEAIIRFLRFKGYRVESAREHGLSGRDDHFHLHEAKRRKCVLLTSDEDLLDHRRFPFSELKTSSVVVLRTPKIGAQFGFVLVALQEEVAASGFKNLCGLKIELVGPRIVFHANVQGCIRTDSIDISKPRLERILLENY